MIPWQVASGSPTRLVLLMDMIWSPMLSLPERAAGPPFIMLAKITVGRMEPQPDSTITTPRISPLLFSSCSWRWRERSRQSVRSHPVQKVIIFNTMTRACWLTGAIQITITTTIKTQTFQHYCVFICFSKSQQHRIQSQLSEEYVKKSFLLETTWILFNNSQKIHFFSPFSFQGCSALWDPTTTSILLISPVVLYYFRLCCKSMSSTPFWQCWIYYLLTHYVKKYHNLSNNRHNQLCILYMYGSSLELLPFVAYCNIYHCNNINCITIMLTYSAAKGQIL